MKTRTTTGAGLLLAALITTAGAAHAGDLVSASNYANELDRCVAAIRAENGIAPDTVVQHRVTAVALDGNWYEFAIESLVHDTQQPFANTLCRAHRLGEKTALTALRAEQRPSRLAHAD